MIFEKEATKESPHCPYVQGPCMKEKCTMWLNVRGQMPADMETPTGKIKGGEIIDQWGCAITWTPVLLVEVAGKIRSGTAATESYRNETVSFFNAFGKMVNDLAGRAQRPAIARSQNGSGEIEHDA